MIFDTPDLRSGTGYPGDPTSLGEVFDVANRGQYHIESVNALHSQIEEEYNARINAIKDAAGVDFSHPLETDPNVERLLARANERGRHWFNKQDILEIQLEEASERLQELQKKHPDLADIIKADAPPHLEVYRKMRKIEGERGDVLTRRGLDSVSGMLTDPLGTGAMFAGALWGMRHSPYDLMALALGGAAGRASYSLLRNALINASANAAAQALVEPSIQRNRAMAGLDSGWQQAMGNIAMAFGIGGTLDLTVRTPGRAFRWWQGQPNVGGFFRDAPTPVAPDFDPAPRVPVPRTPDIPEDLIARAQQGDVQAMTDIAEMVTGQPVQMPEGVTREMIGKAIDGDPEALTQVIERSGLADDPAIKGALDRFILEGGDAEIQTALQRVRDEFAGITTPEGGRIDIDIGQDEQRILQALRAAMDPDEPMPTGGMDLQVARRAALADDEPLPRGTTGTNQHELKLDIFGRPAVVRELDLKLTRLEGDVAALRAQQWSADLAGRVLAYEPKEGPLGIMDGRRRAELAHRVAGDARAQAIVFREADGWTRQEVAALARRKNIAEGKGSPVELAEALRTSPELLDLIDNGTGVTRAARSLAMLSDDAFGMVKAGDADPRMAAMVSNMVANEALHAQLLRDLRRAGIEDLTQARRSLNDLLPQQGQHEANGIMLGFDPDDMPLRAGADVDDPKGPAAKAQVQRLEQELAPEIADARAKGPPPPTPAETAAVAAERAQTVRSAIAQVVGRMPEDFRVETFSAVGDLPDALQAEVLRGNAVAFSNALQRVQAARTPEARARAIADLEAARRGQGVEGFERDGVVYMATYAANPDAVVWHEVVHFLKRTGRLTDDEIALLARRARKENLFDEDLYREAMAGRDDLDARLDEEAAAHLMQARKEGRSFGRKTDGIIDKALRTLEMIGNALRGYGFRTADDVIEAILSGEMARREAVRAVMRTEDVTAAAAKGDTLFAFAGERARTADLDALRRAKEMEAEGKDRNVIWNETGWFRGVDGKWRFEIDDSHIWLNVPEALDSRGKAPLGKIEDLPAHIASAIRRSRIGNPGFLAHPRLFAAYPDLAYITASIEELPGSVKGVYDRGIIRLREADLPTTLHETQHAIQKQERTSRGGNPGMFTPDQIAAERARLSAQSDGGGWTTAGGMPGDAPDEMIARLLYARLAGEVEARTVERRLDYTPEQRKARPPWEDYDVPEDQQIVRLGEGPMFSLRRPTLSIPGLKEKLEARKADEAARARSRRGVFADSPALSTWLGLPNAEFYADIAHIAQKRLAKDGPSSPLATPEKAQAFIDDVLQNGTFAYRYLNEGSKFETFNIVKLGPDYDSVVSVRLRAIGGRYQLPTAFPQSRADTVRRLAGSLDKNGVDGLRWKKDRETLGEILRHIAQAPQEHRGPSWHQLRRVLRQEQEGMGRDDGAMFSLRQEDRPLEGIHFTHADFDRFRVTQARDPGFWGDGVYMFPREYGVKVGSGSARGLSYGIAHDGSRNIPLVVDSKKPFVIDAASPVEATADWDALKAHGWPHDGSPVMVWESRDWDTIRDTIKVDPKFIDEAARLKDEANKVAERFWGIEETIREAPPGQVTDNLLQQRDVLDLAVRQAARAAEAARRQASPNAELSRQFTKALLAAGYDSVVIRSDGTPVEMVAIKPGTVKGTFSGDTMFSLRQGEGTPAAPEAPEIDIPSLAQRLIGIADSYRAAVSGEPIELPDMPSLSLGRSEDGLITSVDVSGETYFVNRDEAGNILGLMSPDEATGRAIADTIRTTARDYGYDLDPERVEAYTAEAMAIVRTAQDDPQGALQAASDLIVRISDEIAPDDAPAMRADNDNEIPSPLRQDLADVDRMNEHAEMVSVCRI